MSGPSRRATAVRAPDLTAVQQRTVRTLLASQITGGIGVASGVAVAALAAEQLSGRESLSGLAQTAGVLGAALAAVPLARVMNRHGRRVGLVAAYLVAAAGAGVCVLAGLRSAYWLLLIGMILYGVATAAGLAARYAATDLAEPATRGRDLGVVVWATTIGAIAGPNLIEPGGGLAGWLGLPRLFGPFVIAFAAFLGAAAILSVRMRPDPLLTARRNPDHGGDAATPAGADEPAGQASLRTALTMIAQSPGARLAVLAIAAAHTVMVGVMSMTAVHMHNGGVTLTIIGVVISVHIASMYVLSPVVGGCADRFGRVPVICVGQLVVLAAVAVAGTAGGHESAQLGVGLALLGIGWSCCLVAGSTLLTESFGLADRPTVQGAADLVMGLCAAGGGALAGMIVGIFGYGALNAAGGVLAVIPLLAIVGRVVRRVA